MQIFTANMKQHKKKLLSTCDMKIRLQMQIGAKYSHLDSFYSVPKNAKHTHTQTFKAWMHKFK